MEGLNNKAKVTLRKSYGFRTYRVLELSLYHSLGKLPEPESTHDFFLRVSNFPLVYEFGSYGVNAPGTMTTLSGSGCAPSPGKSHSCPRCRIGSWCAWPHERQVSSDRGRPGRRALRSPPPRESGHHGGVLGLMGLNKPLPEFIVNVSGWFLASRRSRIGRRSGAHRSRAIPGRRRPNGTRQGLLLDFAGRAQPNPPPNVCFSTSSMNNASTLESVIRGMRGSGQSRMTRRKLLWARALCDFDLGRGTLGKGEKALSREETHE